jgi:hypothetical protein
MKYVIVLKQPIRIGLEVLDCIGPFNAVKDAEDWIMEMNKSSMMPLPPLNVFTLQEPKRCPLCHQFNGAHYASCVAEYPPND